MGRRAGSIATDRHHPTRTAIYTPQGACPLAYGFDHPFTVPPVRVFPAGSKRCLSVVLGHRPASVAQDTKLPFASVGQIVYTGGIDGRYSGHCRLKSLALSPNILGRWLCCTPIITHPTRC